MNTVYQLSGLENNEHISIEMKNISTKIKNNVEKQRCICDDTPLFLEFYAIQFWKNTEITQQFPQLPQPLCRK